MIEDPKVSVIGLGKLGAPIAACFARSCLSVVCVDSNPGLVEMVNRGLAPVHEPGLDAMISENLQHITATEDCESAVLETDTTFIVVPTPSDPEGGFSLQYVLPACEEIGRAIGKKVGYHLVVLTSTVLPGTMDDRVRPLLESTSGRRCGENMGLCYSPEFIALGSVIRDFLNPDFLLIGKSDTRAGDILEALYRRTCTNEPAVARMSFVEAELTKIALNSFITMKITFANTIARMCERLPGADVDTVTEALGHDGRIGGKYLKGAISYGGPCFPRDNIALAFLADSLGVPCQLSRATDEVNRLQTELLAELVISWLPDGGTAGILGLTYKPDTSVVEEAPGMLLASSLLHDGISVCAYDPMGMETAAGELEGGAVLCGSAQECAQESDVIVIATPWPEFRELAPESLVREGAPRILIDCWRILDGEKYSPCVRYFGLGTWMGEKIPWSIE